MKDLHSNEVKIKLFPTIDNVFENLTESHKAVFFPLLTVELNEIEKGNGKVHFISVYGNGNPDVSFSGKNIGYNFIKFKLINDKYLFEDDLNQMPDIENVIEWYQEAEAIYKQHLNTYLQPRNEFEKKYFKKDFVEKQFQFLNQKLKECNKPYIKKLINYWITRDKYIETGKFIQGSAYMGNYSNHERDAYKTLGGTCGHECLKEVLNELEISFDELNFIGIVTGYNYSESGEDEILLFINKDKTEAFQYFNWS